MQNFTFSQSSLQDYVDCPRRFQLRYLLHCDWPAVQTEPIMESERHIARGQAFHRLAHQHALGLPADLLAAVAAHADLADWWDAFLTGLPTDLPPTRRAEVELSASLAGQTVIARYDLLALDADRLIILDWKTNLKRPTRTFLEYRLQTRVYPFVLAQNPPSGKIKPSQIEMTYWFAQFPRQPETFRYSQDKFEADARYLTKLITEITACQDEVFALTPEPRRCRFCVYRSLCERDVEAGSYTEEDADLSEMVAAPEISLEQVAEIVY